MGNYLGSEAWAWQEAMTVPVKDFHSFLRDYEEAHPHLVDHTQQEVKA